MDSVLEWRSVFGIEEGDEAVADVVQKLMELLLGVESIPLVEGGVVVADMFPDLLVEVVTERRHD